MLCPSERTSLKCFSLHSSTVRTLLSPQAVWMAASIKAGVVLRCVKVATGDACHSRRLMVHPCHGESHSLSLSSVRRFKRFLFSKHNLRGFDGPARVHGRHAGSKSCQTLFHAEVRAVSPTQREICMNQQQRLKVVKVHACTLPHRHCA